MARTQEHSAQLRQSSQIGMVSCPTKQAAIRRLPLSI